MTYIPLEILHADVPYDLVRLIAEGGMGLVYEAFQKGPENFKKQVAIKIIREEYSAIKEFRQNFTGEARLVADLIHTNIVQTYHLGVNKDKYFIVMEYVNGKSLEDIFVQHLETNQNIPIDLAAFIISRVCRGLSYAHQRCNASGQHLGIVHRDVNPKNILLSIEGDVKISDFGIAKALDIMYNKEGEVVAGKDEYLSPEQAHKEVTDHRADVFSCGLMLSELVLGYHYFEDINPAITRKNIQQTPAPDFRELRKGIDDRLNHILHASLAKDRKDRYHSARQMLYELEAYLYNDRYGPTNEKLALYVKDLYGPKGHQAAHRWEAGLTPGLQ
jgi:serine/threonine protein kinase